MQSKLWLKNFLELQRTFSLYGVFTENDLLIIWQSDELFRKTDHLVEFKIYFNFCFLNGWVEFYVGSSLFFRVSVISGMWYTRDYMRIKLKFDKYLEEHSSEIVPLI